MNTHYTQITFEVMQEVERSTAKHGDQRHLPLGTGPATWPLKTRHGNLISTSANYLARIATEDTDERFEYGEVSWWHILREEVLEFSAEDDLARARDEAVQVAAVALKIIDAIDSRPPTTRSVI